MTSNPLVYKHKDAKCHPAPQILMLFFAVLIFYHSHYLHNGFFVPASSLQLSNDFAYSYFAYTLSYVLTIVPAGIIATNWSARTLLWLSLVSICVLNAIQTVPKIALVKTDPGSMLSIFIHFLYGLSEAPVIPCVYVLLSRMISSKYRTTAGSVVLSAKHLVALFILGIAFLTNIIKTDDSVHDRTYIILKYFIVIWAFLYLCVVSNYDPQFVNEAPWFKPRVPWRSILSSWPVWTLIASHGTFFDMHEMALFEYPYELPDALFVAKSKSLTMSILLMGGVGSGWLSDVLVARNRLTRLEARKFFNFLATCVPMAGFIILISFKGDENVSIFWACVWLILRGLISFQCSGFLTNHMDLSPYYAGILMALTAAANQLFRSFLVLVLILSKFDTNWSIFLNYTIFILPIFTSILFAIFGKASIQKWSPVPLSYQKPNQLDVKF
ncbi:hypothetical protein TKK_0009292 [Trichogramma kaykai]|uniref:Major facilitator superfamily (MFS) profile domain-containing protein n=1 Tax=Trichogramma kaykai TaxID=54128 RepID=A0ABD2X1X1_9HYME